MRIAQVAPLYESVPPKKYGGTERVVCYLTEELVRRGHQVTLYASGDSKTSARLVAGWPRSLRTDATCHDPLALHLTMLERVIRDRHDYDVLHFHTDYLSFPFARRHPIPYLSTLHGRQDLPELSTLYEEYSDAPIVSISDAQRTPLPDANWLATVYHGLPRSAYPFSDRKGQYLAFLGRVSPEKRLDQAIDIATRVKMPLRIAAKIDRYDREYYQTTIAPLLQKDGIDFIGEISDDEKGEFLGGAAALLFPIDWPEPFGLVLIEAMACGTPVIAYRRGSVPEVIADGETGFLVNNADQAVEAVRRLSELSRRHCRDVFEARFSVERMTDEYLALYTSQIDQMGDAPDEGAHGGRIAWTKSPAFKTSSPSSQPKRAPTNEPAY